MFLIEEMPNNDVLCIAEPDNMPHASFDMGDNGQFHNCQS